MKIVPLMSCFTPIQITLESSEENTKLIKLLMEAHDTTNDVEMKAFSGRLIDDISKANHEGLNYKPFTGHASKKIT